MWLLAEVFEKYIFLREKWKSTRDGIYHTSNRPKTRIKIYYILDKNNSCGYALSNLLPTSGLKWIDPKSFNLNKYAGNSSNRRVLKVDSECPNELPELPNGFPLDPDKI